MSGICGVFRFDENPDYTQKIKKMMLILDKLGPDGSAVWNDRQIVLGHQMMIITPESMLERLPHHDPESGITITMEGRIDNREALCRSLDFSINTCKPDSQFLLCAYKKWGEQCIDHLIGEFTFAIWDKKKRKLFCAVDIMGIRPFFYSLLNRRYFAFASEPMALRAIQTKEKGLNDRYIALLGISGLAPTLEPESTCFSGISRLPAATLLTVTPQKTVFRKYWVPDQDCELKLKSEEECREAYQAVFFKVVKEKLRSKDPVAVMLSGGLDSSGIVATASQLMRGSDETLLALSSVPMQAAKGKVKDELKYINLFKDYDNVDIQYISAEGKGPFDQLDQLVSTGNLSSYIFQHFLFTEIAETASNQGVRLILDGIGGEVSATAYLQGYYCELLLSLKWSQLIKEIGWCKRNSPQSLYAFVKKEIIVHLLPDFFKQMIRKQNVFDCSAKYPIKESFLNSVLGDEKPEIVARLDKLVSIYPNHRKNMINSIELLQNDSRHLVQSGYIGSEKICSSHPYLDQRIIDFALAVPARFKFSKGESRRLFRIGMKNIVPEPILNRRSKIAFSPDYHLRYLEKKNVAAEEIRRASVLNQRHEHIFDINKLRMEFHSETLYNTDRPMAIDYASTFNVPWGVYLLKFLQKHA